jgi:class 3 adenylate cyclase/predicted ATPase
MLCAKCNNDNPADASFCEGCGAKLALACPTCKTLASPGAGFCKKCGTALASASPDSRPASPSESPIRVTADAGSTSEGIEGERKTVTALFADIKGSTEMMAALDPEEARAIIDPSLKLMIDAVHRYGGYVVQSTGDGIFALFGAPVAHEDHPQRAVHAAIAARDDLFRRGDELRKQGRAGVEVRIGINTGEVVMRSVQTGGHTEYSPIGHVINVASRIQSAAPADGVVVSEDTRHLVEGYFELRALGPTELKGIAEPIDVYEVVSTGALRGHFDLAARRGLTKFVGRERDLEQLQRALEQAVGGHGQIVAVIAEAGTGKSRLIYEFKRLIPQSCKVFEAYSVSHGKASAWLPVLELLRRYFGIGDADDPATRGDKVRTALTALDAALDDTLPYLYGLLSIIEGADPLSQMDPQIKRQRTLDAIKRIVLRESLNQPLVVIFEDLHWIDEQTQALLDLLADSIGNAQLLLLVNYRPEYLHPWTNKSHYIQLGLKPLGRESADELLTALLGDAVELNPLKRLAIERTGGNPFFIEEIVQALFDEGALVRNGKVKVTRSLSKLRLPPTVQGILASRIDRLSAEQKDLLQILAVMGRQSSLGLLTQVAPQPATQMERMLAELSGAEFIYEQPSAAGVEYVFKHALTQEVAYNSLLIERRKQLHERTGYALESIFSEQLDDHLTQLAHHYSHSDNIEKAIDYLGRAGQQAIQLSANADAASNLTVAIDLLQKLPDDFHRAQRELQLHMALGSALIPLKGWSAQEVERAFSRVRELCARLGDPPELFPALLGLFATYLLRAKLRMAYGLAAQLLQKAQGAHDSALLTFAYLALGDASCEMGEFILARQHLETAISHYDPVRHRPLAFRFIQIDATVNCLTYEALTLWNLGYPDQALNRSNEAVALARRLSHPHSVAFAEGLLTSIRIHRREWPPAQESAEKVIALSGEHGFALWSAVGIWNRGAALAKQGRQEEGIAQMREGIAAFHGIGAKLGRPGGFCLLAEAFIETGRFEEADYILKEALAAVEEDEARAKEAEMHRLKGELLLKQNNFDLLQAQSCFERAIGIARKQSAKSLELRATTSFARLLAKQDRRGEAHKTLADIYNWFTEGFDTADLIDAKALLDQLGG